MRSTASRHAGALAAVAVAGVLAGCGGGGDGKEEAPEPPSGVISTRSARSIPLDTPRSRFLEEAEVKPVRTRTEHQKPSRANVEDLTPEMRRELERRFGKARDGIIRIPARDFTCLDYRGQDPSRYGWKFCFGEEDRLEYVSTTRPLPADL